MADLDTVAVARIEPNQVFHATSLNRAVRENQRSAEKMNEEIISSRHLGATAVAVAITVVFYPMTIAPIGAASNGGVIGFTSLVVASGLSWWAFALNKGSPWVRRLIQLPVTALVTYMAIQDAYAQCVAGGWLGL